jgi:hypothetical protein
VSRAVDNAEMRATTSLYMENVLNLCSPDVISTVDAEALKDLEVAADAAAASASLMHPLSGAAKAGTSNEEASTTHTGPRTLVELRKIMGQHGVKNLLKTGDTMDFSQASVRLAEVNAVQQRWSGSVLSGPVRLRTIEHKCPFFAARRVPGTEEEEEGGADSEVLSDGLAVAEAEDVEEEEDFEQMAEAPNSVHNRKRKRALPGSKIACVPGIPGSHTPCPFHVRINVVHGARMLQRIKHFTFTGDDDEVFMIRKPEVDEVSELSTTAPTDISATGIYLTRRRGKDKEKMWTFQNEAVVEFANVQHTCQPSSLKLEGKNYVREDGAKKAKKYHPYDVKDLNPIIERIILNRDIDLGATIGKPTLEACFQELSKYVEGDRTKVREIAGKLANDILRAQKVEADTAPLFAQAYAAELCALGHVAGVYIKSAQEAWAQKRRVALAKHAGQQRRLGTNTPFKEDEHRRSHPLPDASSPTVLVGCKATPSYMKLAPVGRYQPIWFKDVGGGRRRSPFQVFHTGIVDGNHQCHPIQDTLLADSESQQGWTPLLESAKQAFPAMNATGARVVKDSHKGSHAACVEVMPNAVPFCDTVHQRKHFLNDYTFGSSEARKKLVAFYDANLRQPHVDGVLEAISYINADPSVTNGFQRMIKMVPMEQLFPSMRHNPTGKDGAGAKMQTANIGCLFNELTSNEAECTMFMFLLIRAEPDLSRAQVMMWQLRQRRWRTSVLKLRRAQEADKRMDRKWRGMTPFVLNKCKVS